MCEYSEQACGEAVAICLSGGWWTVVRFIFASDQGRYIAGERVGSMHEMCRDQETVCHWPVQRLLMQLVIAQRGEMRCTEMATRCGDRVMHFPRSFFLLSVRRHD